MKKYTLTVGELVDLCRDYQKEFKEGSAKSYVKTWLNKKKFKPKKKILLKYRFTKDSIFDFSIGQLSRLCIDFYNDCYDGFVSNDSSYIFNWINYVK